MKRRSFITIIPAVISGVRPELMTGGPAVPEQPSRRPGPPLEVSTLDGVTLRIHEQKGKVVLVDVMTTGCPTCKVASAGLQKLYKELGSKGFCPVGVALDVGTASDLSGYRQQHGITFPLGVAPRDRVVSYLQHSPMKPLMVPTLVFLDRRGNISAIEVGWRGEEAVRASILKLLSEGPQRRRILLNKTTY